MIILKLFFVLNINSFTRAAAFMQDFVEKKAENNKCNIFSVNSKIYILQTCEQVGSLQNV